MLPTHFQLLNVVLLQDSVFIAEAIDVFISLYIANLIIFLRCRNGDYSMIKGLRKNPEDWRKLSKRRPWKLSLMSLIGDTYKQLSLQPNIINSCLIADLFATNCLCRIQTFTNHTTLQVMWHWEHQPQVYVVLEMVSKKKDRKYKSNTNSFSITHYPLR